MIPDIWLRMTEVAYLWVSVSLYVSMYCIVLWWAQGPSLSYLSPWNSAFLVFGLQFMGVFFSLLISDFWFWKSGEWRLMNTTLGSCLFAGWLYVGWCNVTITAKCRFLFTEYWFQTGLTGLARQKLDPLNTKAHCDDFHVLGAKIQVLDAKIA